MGLHFENWHRGCVLHRHGTDGRTQDFVGLHRGYDHPARCNFCNSTRPVDALWRIPDLGHFVGPFTLASTKLEFVTYKDKNFWFWEYQLPQLRLKNKTLLPFSRPLDTVREIRLGSCSESGIFDCSAVLPPRETTGAETDVALAARQILFRKTNGSWTEFLVIGMDKQVLADPVIASNWLALCLASKSATRILVYGIPKVRNRSSESKYE